MKGKTVEEKLREIIRDVPDFPKPGIQFKDITPILADPVLCREIIEVFVEELGDTRVDAILGIESRGFIFGMMLANRLNVPFLIARKAGKLPYKTVQFTYDLEYGSSVMEMHVDSVKPGWNVLVHDDLLATGGTAAAAAELIHLQGGKAAGFFFVVELSFLPGRKKLEKFEGKISSLIRF